MMKQLPPSERPREKAMVHGIESLSNRELLALLIRSGTAGHSAYDIADDLLKDGLAGLSRMTFSDLCSIDGISKVKALEILAWNQLGHRTVYETIQNKDVIDDPDATEGFVFWRFYSDCMFMDNPIEWEDVI